MFLSALTTFVSHLDLSHMLFLSVFGEVVGSWLLLREVMTFKLLLCDVAITQEKNNMNKLGCGESAASVAILSSVVKVH